MRIVHGLWKEREYWGEARDILLTRETWGLCGESSQCSLEPAQRHAPGYKAPWRACCGDGSPIFEFAEVESGRAWVATLK